MKSIDFFLLYVVQKSPNFFLQWPKKFCYWQKNNTAWHFTVYCCKNLSCDRFELSYAIRKQNATSN